MIRPKGIISQKFGENANDAYKKLGLKGHTGIDFVSKFKGLIYAVNDGLVYKVLNKKNPDLQKFRAVYTISNIKGIGLAEILYGHLWDIWVDEGEKVVSAQPIGTEGDTGEYVYHNGVLVSPEEKPEGLGHHLHLQVRPVERTNKIEQGEHYLRNKDGNPYFDGEKFYRVIHKNNGYNGCVDYIYDIHYPNIGEWLKLYTKTILNISKQVLK